jgi:lysophospholipase L1-like esterase
LRRAREAVLALGSLLLALLALELGLRAFSRHPLDDAATRISDPVLRWRMNPALPDVDERGFRNPAALARAEIAVLGDSFAYGFNAPPEGAWPRQLERASGRSTYSFGVGGYGVLEYWHLLDEALALGPRRVLVSLYLANDLTDVCPRLAESQAWRAFAAARGLEVSGCPPPAAGGVRRREPAAEPEPWSWLVQRSALASLVELVTLEPRLSLAVRLGRVDGAFVVDEPGLRASLYLRRLRGVRERTDLARPEVAAGFSVARAFFAAARERTAAAGARLAVVLVPSKERVHARRLAALPDRPAAFDDAVRSEGALVAATADMLGELGVPFVDALPWLERALDERGPLYPLRRDDHPFEPGYRAIAEAAAELLTRLDAEG